MGSAFMTPIQSTAALITPSAAVMEIVIKFLNNTPSWEILVQKRKKVTVEVLSAFLFAVLTSFISYDEKLHRIFKDL